MIDLKQLSSEVSGLFRDRGKRMAGLSFWGKVALVPIFAGVAGVSQFTDFESGKATAAQVCGISASIVVAVLSFVLGFADKDGADELAKAHEAVEAARIAQADLTQIDVLEMEHEQAIQLVESLSLMRALIESVLVAPAGTEVQFMQALLKASSRNLRVAMGFQSSHRWTITVYQAVSSAHRTFLTPVATSRAIECSLDNARSWEAGTGIAGASYANSCEVVIPDLTRPGLKELFGTKANASKEDDLDLYRSMAASPVRLDGRSHPWGVVVATSDQLAHFNADAFAAMRPDVVVKELAGIIALAAAAYSRISTLASTAPSLPDTEDDEGTKAVTNGFTNILHRMFNRGRAT
ncbi:hypothetical protein Q5H91_12395 [Sphingomonas sp. KR1UV-12]|uniref:GAF domain-containing protein n=1 Tax=Sphingomonas aurea TaxID=3063994 RepID=A0ABT9EM41_9SPHN|nr:hypothetical protein [Sphingomonas sp. KR1UV-12]MDP1028015.1 hypothetical protein [Sphingomonas sp. KR1UV-12]